MERGIRGAAPLGIRAIALAAAVCLARPEGLRAGEEPDPHSVEAAPVDTSDLTSEQRARIERLFNRVICVCPEENWTRTLAGCPHACSDRQKEMIRRDVKDGLTDEEILAEQVQTFGTEMVLAIPRSAAATLVPFLILVAFTVGVIALLAASLRPKRDGAASPGGGAGMGAATEEDRRISDAVERDLEGMDR